ncbi:MAG: hypothetical protein HC768_13325 [Acaryochloris sp. CRU_2_0]|nr:hypothetical protein [Acaryochloris sp. CRU_2_0]
MERSLPLSTQAQQICQEIHQEIHQEISQEINQEAAEDQVVYRADRALRCPP